MSTQALSSKRLAFDDAHEAIEYYFAQGWSDGLPIVPPTADKVQGFLDYAGRSPSEIVGTEPVKGRVITAEKVAVNAVMAGCLPEYSPVVLAAVEAICQPQFNLHAISASTMGAAVLTIVNGPVARGLGINSGVSLFSPGRRPNATIGRAIRLVICNATGALPGVLDQATLGHPGRYSWCIAEAEEVSPWEPLHVERGLTPGQSAVTVFAGLSPIQATNHVAATPEAILTSLGDSLFAAGPSQTELAVVICPELVGHIKRAGWSKRLVKEFLFQVAQRKVSEWARREIMPGGASLQDPEQMIGVARSPEGITVLVAGGTAGAYSAVIPMWAGGANSRSVTWPVRVPK